MVSHAQESSGLVKAIANNALHLTAIPLRLIVASELGCYESILLKIETSCNLFTFFCLPKKRNIHTILLTAKLRMSADMSDIVK